MEERELIIVFLTEGERERKRGRVANGVCDVGIDQSHRQTGGT